jgi:hypothetical protein
VTKKASSPGRLTWAFGARHEGLEPPTARSVDKCSPSDWLPPDSSDQLTWDASSVASDREGARWIVWMIKWMIE